MASSPDRQIVYRVEDGMDRQAIECTTYQMRNFYRQMQDGFFSHLDIMNYIQHYWIAKLCSKGDRVLDVCCGRGLMLPLLRYHAKNIASYTGVDIEPKNATWRFRRVTDGKPVGAVDYYPFSTKFVHANVADMSLAFDSEELFDVIIYTSAIEHMHKESGLQSLKECWSLAAPGARMVLTTPNTPLEKDGYDTRYRAHVYEWKIPELEQALDESGWEIVEKWGLTIGKRALEQVVAGTEFEQVYKLIAKFVPREFLCPALAPAFPGDSDEIAYLVQVKE